MAIIIVKSSPRTEKGSDSAIGDCSKPAEPAPKEGRDMSADIHAYATKDTFGICDLIAICLIFEALGVWVGCLICRIGGHTLVIKAV